MERKVVLWRPFEECRRKPDLNRRRARAMASQAERAARNEALFREVNEAVRDAAERFESELTEFFCECGDPQCLARITLTLSAYEAVRSRSERFAVAHGHDAPEVERIVETRGGYVIVEKFGEGADIARRLDRRD